MKSKRKICFWTIFWMGILLLLAAFAMVYQFWGRKEPRNETSELKVIEMQVGEIVDLNQQFQPGYIVDGFLHDVEGVFLDEDGKLHAQAAGRYEFPLNVRQFHFFDIELTTLIRLNVIVYDYEFSHYRKIYQYEDLIQVHNGERVILGQPLVVRDRHPQAISSFSGILDNPEGYPIVIEDNLPLFTNVDRNAIVRNLDIRSGEGGFAITWHNVCGVLSAMCEGVVKDCAVRGDLQRVSMFPVGGVVGIFYDGAYMSGCLYEGNVFRAKEEGYPNGERENVEKVFGIVALIGGKQRIFDCQVRADAYLDAEKDIDQACSLYAFAGQSDLQSRVREDGNRVFNLAGNVEIDFNQIVTYQTVYQNDDVQTARAFAGSVVPRRLDYFHNQEIYCLSVQCNVGDPHPERPFYLPAATVTPTVEYIFRYRETKIGQGQIIRSILAAEEEIVLPEDCMLGTRINFGRFSPENRTIILASDTKIEGDSGFVHDTDGKTVALDFSKTEVYDMRDDGSVYTKDGSTLCRYGGQVVDGTVKLPDDVQFIGYDPFGDLAFTKLDTNRLIQFTELMGAPWRDRPTVIRLGTDFLLYSGMDFYHFDFPSLQKYETAVRSDGYRADDNGWLVYDDTLLLVPSASAVGEDNTIVVEGFRQIGRYAFHGTQAKKLVLCDVSVNQDAILETSFESIQFRGTVQVSSQGINYAKQLVAVETEENASVELQSRAFYQCPNLVEIELNDRYESVAYDAVVFCSSFDGYRLAADCNKFIVANGLLFADQSVYIPDKWTGTVLEIPDGLTALQVNSNRNYFHDLEEIVIGKDLTSLHFSSDNIRTQKYTLRESNTALAVEDGAVYDADKTTLYFFPANLEREELTLPASVRTINDGAFMGARLGQVTLNEGLVHIGKEAFYSSSLTVVNFPESLRTVGEKAFAQTKLREIHFNQGLESVGVEAFKQCSKLAVIDIAGGRMKIGSGCFDDTAYFNDVRNVQNGAIYLENIMFGVAPYGVEDLVVREGTTTILSLSNPYLKSITIPSTATRMASTIDCERLEEVRILSSDITVENWIYGGAKVYLPKRVRFHASYYGKKFKIFYDGTAEDFAEYAFFSLRDFAENVYFRSDEEPTRTGNYWHYVAGKMTAWDNPVVADSFSYTIGFMEDASGNSTYYCNIYSYSGNEDVITTPKYSPHGFLVTEIGSLNYGIAREIHFSGGIIGHIYGREGWLQLISLTADCRLTQYPLPSCKVLKSDIPSAVYHCAGVESVVFGKSVQSVTINVTRDAQIFYEGTEAEWANVSKDFGSTNYLIAFYSAQEPTAVGEVRYWYYDQWGIPVLWPNFWRRVSEEI